ncbi:MAG: hypothetical protein U0795_04055 [Pirellulales bacterium]
MRLVRQAAAVLSVVLASSGLAQAYGIVAPSSVTTDMQVREFFQNDPNLGSIENTIDGDLSTGIVTETSTGVVDYFFAPWVNGATGFSIWNNAGFQLADGESIGLLDIEVRDSSNNSLFSQANVVVPEGNDGNPFTIDFGGPINGVASVHLQIKANNGSIESMDGTAWREVAINCVPEPASLGLLGALVVIPFIRRRVG